MSLVMEHLRALRRFSLFRWQTAVHLSWPLLWITRMVFDWPPAGFENWPTEAKWATQDLIQGCSGIVFAGWLSAVLAPVVWISNRQMQFVVRIVCGALLGWFIVMGLVDLVSGLCCLPSFPAPGVRVIVLTAARVVGIPVAFGLVPIAWYLIDRQWHGLPILRRWLRAGRGATGGFMTGEEIRKFTRPLPRRLA